MYVPEVQQKRIVVVDHHLFGRTLQVVQLLNPAMPPFKGVLQRIQLGRIADRARKSKPTKHCHYTAYHNHITTLP